MLAVSKIRIEGRLLDILPEANSLVEARIKKALANASEYLWQKVIEATPTSVGTLRKSITRDLHPTYAEIYPQMKYGYWVHEGSSPHWIPKKEMLPGGTLYRWAQKKGIPVFLVARAIARKGTKGNPWMANTYEKEWPRIQKIFRDELNDFSKEILK